MNSLKELIQQLPPDLEQEAEGFVRFLKKRAPQHGQTPEQDRASALRDYREQYAALPELVQSLPSEMQQEVQDFIEFLLEKQGHRPKGPFKLDWRGALRDLRDQYTSVELQHKITEWWTED
jgi:Protein of unknown function (DUF2281)